MIGAHSPTPISFKCFFARFPAAGIVEYVHQERRILRLSSGGRRRLMLSTGAGTLRRESGALKLSQQTVQSEPHISAESLRKQSAFQDYCRLSALGKPKAFTTSSSYFCMCG